MSKMADKYGMAAEPIKLGDKEYFVLGDNRNKSKIVIGILVALGIAAVLFGVTRYFVKRSEN